LSDARAACLPHRYAIGEGKGASFILYPEQKLVVITLGNRVTINQLEEYARLLQLNPCFTPSFSEIADMRAAEEIALGADEMMRMADEIDPFSYEAKRAFVVKTPSQAHAARMHKILLTHRNFEIFRSMEEAQRWIHA
jgi:hypothetical protein